MLIRKEDRIRINYVLKDLIGQTVCLLRKQNYFGFADPDFIHVKFGNNISLNISNFMRMTHNGAMILSSCDETFTTDYQEIKSEYTGEEINDKSNLLTKHIDETLQVLKCNRVKNATLSAFGDLTIVFDDNIKLCAYVDVKMQGEYLRIKNKETEFVFFFDGNDFRCEKGDVYDSRTE